MYLTKLLNDGTHETARAGYGGDNVHGFEIATDNNDVKYLSVFIHWKQLADEYYTVKNGEWVAVLTRDYSLNWEYDWGADWYVDGNLVEKEVYDRAPETELGIVDTRETPNNPDAVYAVLAELAELTEKAGVVMDDD